MKKHRVDPGIRRCPIGYCNPDVLALRLSTFYRALQNNNIRKLVEWKRECIDSEEKRGTIELSFLPSLLSKDTSPHTYRTVHPPRTPPF